MQHLEKSIFRAGCVCIVSGLFSKGEFKCHIHSRRLTRSSAYHEILIFACFFKVVLVYVISMAVLRMYLSACMFPECKPWRASTGAKDSGRLELSDLCNSANRITQKSLDVTGNALVHEYGMMIDCKGRKQNTVSLAL